eukprot:CAMPEP_0119320114 /NCGR_PEP_ID=MMETSP1333-20130426/51505_1 /TAXON_ID=418940 /ORGANISM="Scyphosphaera apsteinii, Strain RCC1455" /LENGTH=194 /DNA_ID=CAMNT_0007326743 /DNA_START=43 /DNA_END=627 /DNA_ORIENTATION=+
MPFIREMNETLADKWPLPAATPLLKPEHPETKQLPRHTMQQLNCQDFHKELAALPSSRNMFELLETLCKVQQRVATSLQRTEALIERAELQGKKNFNMHAGNDRVAKLAKGEKCLYTRNSGTTVTVAVIKVHWDNGEAYYTIFDDGKELSTVRERLVPIRKGMEVPFASTRTSLCSGMARPASWPNGLERATAC